MHVKSVSGSAPSPDSANRTSLKARKIEARVIEDENRALDRQTGKREHGRSGRRDHGQAEPGRPLTGPREAHAKRDVRVIGARDAHGKREMAIEDRIVKLPQFERGNDRGPKRRALARGYVKQPAPNRDMHRSGVPGEARSSWIW